MRGRRALALLLALVAATAATAATAAPVLAAARAKVSFTQVESKLMCVACHESLAVANSPESYSERQYVRTLIAQGLTEKQILNSMVASYGTVVLAQPPASGISILVYVIPPLVVVVGLLTIAYTLPRWRARRASAQGQEPAAPTLDPADAARLDRELARGA